MNTFAIAGLHRSGTKFLAETMNLSPTWTVLHEGPDTRSKHITRVDLIQRRFRRDHYGEVSGYLVQFIDKLKLGRRGVILRDPAEAWLSITTYHSATYTDNLKSKWKHDLLRLKRDTPQVLKLAESGKYVVIDFRRMTTDPQYLGRVLRLFGVDDVEVTAEMVARKVNASPKTVRRTSWADFSREVRNDVQRLGDAYLRRSEAVFKAEEARRGR